MARAKFVKKARKSNPVVTQEDIDNHTPENGRASYYWWAFRTAHSSCKKYSKTKPKPSQLTQSEYLSNVLALQEEHFNSECIEDLEQEVEEVRSALEEIRRRTLERLDNIPEGPQQSDTGQLLQDRIDSLEEAIDELDGLDFTNDDGDYDDDALEDAKESAETAIANVG